MAVAPDDGTTRPARMLLVEDDANDAELTRLLVAETGDAWEVEVVARIASAIERLGRGGIDVVVMDLGLPDGTGPKAVHEVVTRAAGVPVIVLTGSIHDERIEREARQAGALDCLVKGEVDASGLRRSLRRALRRPPEPGE